MGTNKYDDVRELLNRVHTFLSNLCRDAMCDDHCSECIGASDLADDVYDLLHSPRRNCDVGTAEEQTTRYRKFCSDHKYLGSDFSYTCKGFGKGRCPFFNSHTKSKCEFAWSQTPYEEHEGEQADGKGRTD